MTIDGTPILYDLIARSMLSEPGEDHEDGPDGLTPEQRREYTKILHATLQASKPLLEPLQNVCKIPEGPHEGDINLGMLVLITAQLHLAACRIVATQVAQQPTPFPPEHLSEIEHTAHGAFQSGMRDANALAKIPWEMDTVAGMMLAAKARTN